MARSAVAGGALIAVAIGFFVVAAVDLGWGLGEAILLGLLMALAATLLGWLFDYRETGRPVKVANAEAVEFSGSRTALDLALVVGVGAAGAVLYLFIGPDVLVAGAAGAAVIGASLLLRARAFRQWEGKHGAVIVRGADGRLVAQWQGEEDSTVSATVPHFAAGYDAAGDEEDEEDRPPARTSVEAGTFVALTVAVLAGAWALSGFATVGEPRDLALIGVFFVSVLLLSVRWESRELPTTTWVPAEDVSTGRAIGDAVFLFVMLLVVVGITAFVGVPSLGMAIILAVAAFRAGQCVALLRWERSRHVVIVNDPAVPERYVALRR